jgi:O-methyltransferase
MTLRADPKEEREILAVGAGPDPEQLRTAYLELLKLALTDLAGAETLSVEFLIGGRVYSRRMPREHLEPRVDGRDWPFGGLTMGGLKRLDDLQGCVETLVAERITGDLIEAGTWRGGSSILMRATLDTLGADDRDVWVADSFQGFPGAGEGPVVDPAAEEMSMLEFLSIPVEEVKASFERLGLGDGVRFVPGFFAQTMPKLRGRSWSLVRLDGDSYEATRDCLDALYPGLAKGGYLVVDDYGAIEVCRRAVDDYRREHGITEPLEQVDWTCVRWRREGEPEAGPTASADSGEAEEIPPAAAAGTEKRIPDIHELQLENEIAELRRRGPR